MMVTEREAQVQVQTLTIAELDAITSIHVAAFPKSALSALGAEAIRRYYDWLLTGPHNAFMIGAVLDDRLVGFCFAGRFRGALSGFVQKNRRFLIGQVVTHPWLLTDALFRERISVGLRVLRARLLRQSVSAPTLVIPPATSFGILAIATEPAYQGRGIGHVLMSAAEQAALDRGCDQMHLTVSPQNTSAVRFYERLKWEKVAPDGRWNGQMTKRLIPARDAES